MTCRTSDREEQPVTVAAAAPERATSPARDRLLAGLAASIKERGYRDTKIADIVRHARTSRRTFYEVFETKDDCFFALLQERNRRSVASITAAIEAADAWDDQVRAGVTAWIESLATDPEVGISWVREFTALGDRAAKAQRSSMRTFTRLITTLTSTPQMRLAGVEPASEARAAILLGGLRELAVTVLEEGGDIHAITEEAVAAALALLGPPVGVR
jgi:AcrR family transcriptional regulator